MYVGDAELGQGCLEASGIGEGVLVPAHASTAADVAEGVDAAGFECREEGGLAPAVGADGQDGRQAIVMMARPRGSGLSASENGVLVARPNAEDGAQSGMAPALLARREEVDRLQREPLPVGVVHARKVFDPELHEPVEINER